MRDIIPLPASAERDFAINLLRRDGVAAAEEFLERNVRDPEVRRQAREQLDQAGEQSQGWWIGGQ